MTDERGWIASHVLWARPENVARLARAIGVALPDPPIRAGKGRRSSCARADSLLSWKRRAARLIRERLEDQQ